MAYTYSKIASVTVGSGGASSIDFLAIPQNYTDLVIKASLRNTDSATNRQIRLRFNSNSNSIYSYRNLQGEGSSVVSTTESSISQTFSGIADAATATSNVFGNAEYYIPNYTGSAYKSISGDSVQENNATEGYQNLTAALMASSSPITSISIITNSGNWVQYSTATLYGIKAEV